MVNHKVQAAAIKHAVDISNRILLVGHKKPDADTLGSVCAWINFLEPRGKQVEAFCLDPVPPFLQHLPGHDRVKSDPSVFQKDFELIIINDSGSLDYAGVEGFLSGLDRKKTKLINIDHHSTNPHYGDINLVLPDASATTEVLCRLFTHWGIEITKPVAESLLNGLVTDTDSLTNPATSYHSLATASLLVRAGADLHDIVKRTLRHKSVAQLKLWGRALSRLIRNADYNSVSTYITDEDFAELGLPDESNDSIINYLTLIPDADILLCMRTRSDGTIKGSLRTVRQHIDVGKLAATFGGGGHRKASGFKIDGKLEVTENGWTIV